MAASAVSTTGLGSVNTPEAYGFFGQVVLLLGIQLGGLGYMTMGSFAILSSRGSISQNRINIGRSVFAMPEDFDPAHFIRRVVVFSIGVEAVGAIALYFVFVVAEVEHPIWAAIFHSVSSFCTAGFSIFPDNLESFRINGWVNAIISTLSLLGAVGFIVLSDFYNFVRHRTRKITLTSKIILVATFGGVGTGTIALFFDHSISSLPVADRIGCAFFQSMSAMTTVGFNSIPIGGISLASLMIVMVLMILGASPSGTGGGLKSTSWSAGLASAWSVARGRKETTFFGYKVPNYRIQAAFASFTLYLLVFAGGCFVLLLADRHKFEDVVFEVASGLGTVGLSRGITGDLTAAGKFSMVILMYIGRVGVLSLGLAALERGECGEDKMIDDDIVI